MITIHNSLASKTIFDTVGDVTYTLTFDVPARDEDCDCCAKPLKIMCVRADDGQPSALCFGCVQEGIDGGVLVIQH